MGPRVRSAVASLYVAFAPLPSLGQTAPMATAPAANRTNAGVTGATNILLPTTLSGAQSDSCALVQSAGYGSPALGVTFDIARNDANCSRIRKAKVLADLQLHYAAVQMMCQDPAVHSAMKAANTPCEGQAAPKLP